MCMRISNIWAYVIWKHFFQYSLFIYRYHNFHFLFCRRNSHCVYVFPCFHHQFINCWPTKLFTFEKFLCLCLFFPLPFLLAFSEFQVHAEAFDPFEVYFSAGGEAKDPVSFFYIWWSVSQIFLVKDAVFSPVCIFNIFVKAQGSAVTWASLHPLYCSIDLHVCSCASTRLLLFTMALQYNLKSVWWCLQHYSLFFKITLSTHVFLKWIWRFYSEKNDMEILIRISLNL